MGEKYLTRNIMAFTPFTNGVRGKFFLNIVTV